MANQKFRRNGRTNIASPELFLTGWLNDRVEYFVWARLLENCSSGPKWVFAFYTTQSGFISRPQLPLIRIIGRRQQHAYTIQKENRSHATQIMQRKHISELGLLKGVIRRSKFFCARHTSIRASRGTKLSLWPGDAALKIQVGSGGRWATRVIAAGAHRESEVSVCFACSYAMRPPCCIV